jgi:hypothetical protein
MKTPARQGKKMKVHLENTRDGLSEYVSSHPEAVEFPEGR